MTKPYDQENDASLAGAFCTNLGHSFDGTVRDANGDCPKCAPGIGVEAVLAGLNEERYAGYEAQAEKTMLDRLNKAVDRHQEATETPVRAVARPGRVILSLDKHAASWLTERLCTDPRGERGTRYTSETCTALDNALADFMTADQ